MKNKLIFLFLFATSSLLCANTSDLRVVHIYKNVPMCPHKNNTMLQIALICASWAAKYTVYTFEELKYHDDKTEFVAYNSDCMFSLRMNRRNHECEIEFNADDDSFNYSSFKEIMDFYFLNK